jgi:hypothetical protein
MTYFYYIIILTLARLGRLCFENLRFFKMCSQNAGNAISDRDPNFKNFLGACPQIPLAISCLRYSAHTFSDRILSWGRRANKMGLLAVLPHH